MRGNPFHLVSRRGAALMAPADPFPVLPVPVGKTCMVEPPNHTSSRYTHLQCVFPCSSEAECVYCDSYSIRSSSSRDTTCIVAFKQWAQLNQSASGHEQPLLWRLFSGQRTCLFKYTFLSNFFELSFLFISFIWLSSLVLPEVRRKTKAKSYYYVSWCRVCAPPYTMKHESRSIGTHSKRFTMRFTGLTHWQSQTPLLVGFVFPPFHCSISTTAHDRPTRSRPLDLDLTFQACSRIFITQTVTSCTPNKRKRLQFYLSAYQIERQRGHTSVW
jgi:hypothetical protein